jgi:hypothetical protein
VTDTSCVDEQCSATADTQTGVLHAAATTEGSLDTRSEASAGFHAPVVVPQAPRMSFFADLDISEFRAVDWPHGYADVSLVIRHDNGSWYPTEKCSFREGRCRIEVSADNFAGEAISLGVEASARADYYGPGPTPRVPCVLETECPMGSITVQVLKFGVKIR